MDELTYEKLTEVFGRLEAELIESLLEAHGINVELIQEAVGHSVYPVTIDGLGRVQIFVPKKQLAEAQEWLTDYRKNLVEEQETE
jgi:hypothetical protein